jgi:hypothetical protein
MSFESETRCCRLMLDQVSRILDETKERAVVRPERRTDRGRGVLAADALELGAELLATALTHSDAADSLVRTEGDRAVAKEIDGRLLTLLVEMEGRGVEVKKGPRWKALFTEKPPP